MLPKRQGEICRMGIVAAGYIPLNKYPDRMSDMKHSDSICVGNTKEHLDSLCTSASKNNINYLAIVPRINIPKAIKHGPRYVLNSV